MAIAMEFQSLLKLRADIVTIFRDLSHSYSYIGRYRDWEVPLNRTLEGASATAAKHSWGTTDEIYRRAPHLVDALNGIAYHAGAVTDTGAAKPRSLEMAIDQAREANKYVHQALFDVNPQMPREYLW